MYTVKYTHLISFGCNKWRDKNSQDRGGQWTIVGLIYEHNAHLSACMSVGLYVFINNCWPSLKTFHLNINSRECIQSMYDSIKNVCCILWPTKIFRHQQSSMEAYQELCYTWCKQMTRWSQLHSNQSLSQDTISSILLVRIDKKIETGQSDAFITSFDSSTHLYILRSNWYFFINLVWANEINRLPLCWYTGMSWIELWAHTEKTIHILYCCILFTRILR